MSTYADQQDQGILFKKILKDHKGSLVPDLTLILDIAVEEAKGRGIREKRKKKEHFDKNFEFMEKVRQLHLELPEKLPDRRFQKIDGTNSSDEVFSDVQEAVEKIINS